MTYLLLGTPELQLFAKSTTVLYGLLIILLFWSFGVRRKSDAGLFGGFLFAVLTFHYLGFEFLTWGYADLPLAFFAFLTFYAAYRNQVLLALVFSLGALLTKQGGIYVVVAVIIWRIVSSEPARGPLAACRGVRIPHIKVGSLHCRAHCGFRWCLVHR